MLRSHLWLTVLVGAALLAVQASPAAAAPIVFDFEDGLQGWTLGGSAQRVQTQVLGGEWAIFGDGFVEGEATSITPPEGFSLSGFASVSWDTFFVDGDEEGPWLVVRGVDLIEDLSLQSCWVWNTHEIYFQNADVTSADPGDARIDRMRHSLGLRQIDERQDRGAGMREAQPLERGLGCWTRGCGSWPSR